MVVAVEHNGIAQSTPTDRQLAGTIAGRAAGFGVAYLRLDTADIPAMRDDLAEPFASVRGGGGPLVVEFGTQRLGPHSKGDDSRGPDEMATIRARDWHPRYAAAFGPRFTRLDAEQEARVAAVVRDVSSRPASVWSGQPSSDREDACASA
jgi:pyruvate dehydrogenase E1 component alpha subunit